jgi:hypothetical protein
MRSTDDHPAFLDTPGGLITASGVHFHTTRALLEQYAGPVLEVVGLDTLVGRAEVWLRSGQTVALWSLALLLLVLPPLGAVLAALTIYLGWETLGPSFVSRRLVAVLRVLEKPIVQAALYIAVLSYLGAQGNVGAVGVGLAGFVLMRWRVLPLALRPVLKLLRRPLYTLPPPDQVLRAFVLRAALRHNIDLPQLEQLKRDLRR